MLPSQVECDCQARSSLQIRRIGSSKDENPSDMNDIRVEGLRLFVVEGLLFGSWNMRGELVWLRLRNLSSFLFPRSISLRRLKVLEIEGSGYSIEQLFNNSYSDLPWHLNDLKVVCTRGSTSMDFDLNVVDTRGSTSTGFPAPGQTESSRKRKYIVPGIRQYESPFFRYLKSMVTGMRTLTRLVLKNLNSLQSLPIDFSELQNIRHLDLSGCYNLSKLPSTFSELMQLQYLALQDCMNLSIPLDIFGEISTLEYVNFKGREKLVGLPEGIPYQNHLRYLNLLHTSLLQLRGKLEILDKLEQLIIGTHQLKEIPLSMANLRGLKELFLIDCSGLKRILPEGIAAENIKILAIDSCPIANIRFRDQGNVDAENFGMRFLTNFTLRNTSITEICIPEGVYPTLETIDLSANTRLMQVNAMPSALVSLNLENCKELKTLTNLSNLVNLKFLFINRCLGLETLNVEGLISLEDIEAEKCWKLKRIEGLSQRECLTCLNISTDTRVIWTVICDFLAYPSRERLSMVIFTGKADNEMLLYEGEIRCTMEVFNLQMNMVDIVSPTATTRSVVKIENFHLYGGILICFITNAAHRCTLRVKFYPDSYDYHSPTQYSCQCGEESGRSLHIFMWTEDSILFKDYKSYAHVYVDCIDIGANESVERGWLLKVDKKTDALKVCKEFITAFA